MHQIHKADNQKCIDTKSVLHITLLQIRSTPLGPGLLSPATLLFNCQKRSIMQIISRLPISPNNNDEYYEALVERGTKKDKNHDTPQNYDFISIGSTVVVQQEDGRLWTYGKVVGKGDHTHNRLYTIHVTMTG